MYLDTNKSVDVQYMHVFVCLCVSSLLCLYDFLLYIFELNE